MLVTFTNKVRQVSIMDPQSCFNLAMNHKLLQKENHKPKISKMVAKMATKQP